MRDFAHSPLIGTLLLSLCECWLPQALGEAQRSAMGFALPTMSGVMFTDKREDLHFGPQRRTQPLRKVLFAVRVTLSYTLS